MRDIIVTLNSFDIEEVVKRGQDAYLPLIAQSGARGAEIRRELFADCDRSALKGLRESLEQLKLFSVYSAPVELYKQDNLLDHDSIKQVILEAITLGSRFVKFSLGHFDPKQTEIQELTSVLRALKVEENRLQVLIENDQTSHGGNLERIQQFLKEASKQQVPIAMTFDVGNWKFTGEDVEKASEKLADYVKYIHFKQVEETEKGLVTIPLPEEEHAEWRNILHSLDQNVPRAIEFPLRGADLLHITSYYTALLKEA
ncbi:sugar phosphate isomerase/epimerase family protein [Fictibacillus phosphorivorans]|uniref:sugar phosphate isomerase/epimerase family protein n=1 Tax=Fictibacillus phosphorivorans TaxID=1221500 RepID=UPI00203EF069|nr:TIM barrel protein [Fictibacillus phosphorivorans]MCM3719017.1 TIM barrel protein [Fictibacillus phosphorivorans]MCM3776639.1 TIM barrel protein [Fictibacillus phosphorivorans]